MAQHDLYRQQDRSGYLLDCQADALSNLNTRFVVPLLPPDEAPTPGARLNPIFRVGDDDLVMVTQFASSIGVRDLGPAAGSLAEEHLTIMNALDMLIAGY